MAKSQCKMVFYDDEPAKSSECDQRLGECFGKRAAEKYANQVALVIGAAFEIVDRIGGLGQRFGCIT